MTLDQALAKLESAGLENVRAMHTRNGYLGEMFGVRMGDIRAVAKEIKFNPDLARELWATANLDARLLAVLITKPKSLSAHELEQMVSDSQIAQLADWVNSYLVKAHPQKEEFRARWMDSDDPWLARSGWSLTAEAIAKADPAIDHDALLDRIEREMANAPAPAQWTMNFALAYIGIYSPEHRMRARAVGEKLGVYRDYPTPKGCTSPFAPLWIDEMARRQQSKA